ncbi:Ribosomal protein [Tyrophagus putrescentiae]|nr:Ribosomal protein [Tyrophagus putrescentiae]
MLSRQFLGHVARCSRSVHLVHRYLSGFSSKEFSIYIRVFISSFRSMTLSAVRLSPAAAQAAADAPVMAPTEVDPKIRDIVGQIAKLTLLEVAELNQALKETLKIPDAPVMSFAAGAVPAAGAAKAEDEDADNAKTVQTAFTLKVTKFDETKKVALIKEIKNLVEGLNLVQAKKFVESVPQVVKEQHLQG